VQCGEVDDDVRRGSRDLPAQHVGVAHVQLVELGVGMKPFAATSRKIVHDRDVLSARDEPFDEVAADESSSTRDQYSPRHTVQPDTQSRIDNHPECGIARDRRQSLS
jgi:hypothetical protein